MRANIDAVVESYSCKLRSNAINRVAGDLPKALELREFVNLPMKAICEILKKSRYKITFEEAKELMKKLIGVHGEDASQALVYLKIEDLSTERARSLVLMFDKSDVFTALGEEFEDGGIEVDYQTMAEEYQKQIKVMEMELTELKKPQKPSDEEFIKFVEGDKREEVKKALEAFPELANVSIEGITPIKACSRKGLVEMMKLLVSYESAVDVADRQGWTALHETADFGHLEATKFLLECGADINRQDNSGRTPLFWASARGRVEVVKLLLARGADRTVKNKNGVTPFGAAKDALTAAAFGIDNGNDNDENEEIDDNDENNDDSKEEMLLRAIKNNDERKVIELVRDDRELANTIFMQGVSAVKLAARQGHERIVQILAVFGADVNRRDFCGWTPLHEAADCGHIETARVLLRYGAAINLQDRRGQTALHWASKHGHADVCRLLIDHAADPSIMTEDGKKPVDVAANNACVAALKPNHFSEIFYAVHNDDEAAVRSLLSRFPTLVKAIDSLDATPLKAISRKGNHRMMRVLIDLGAEVDYVDPNGWTALHETCDFGRLEATKLLVEKGADINKQDGAGRTPLFWASLRGRVEIVRYLLSHGANPNIPNNKGQKPKDVAKDTETLRLFQ